MTAATTIRHAPLALLCMALPCAAQIAPEDLWSIWQSGEGLTVTAESTSNEGGTLILEGVVAELGDGATMQVARVELAPDGDGVRITQSSDLELALPAEGRTIEVAMQAPGAVTRATRQGQGPVGYALQAPELVAMSDNLAATPDEPPVAATATFADLSADYAPEAGGTISGALSAGSIALDGRSEDADGTATWSVRHDGVDGRFAGSVAALAGLGAGNVPMEESLSVAATSRATAQRVTWKDAEGEVTLSSDGALGGLSVGATGGRVRYTASRENMEFTATGDRVPLPDARATLARTWLGLDLPAAPSTDPQAARIDLELSGLGVSDQVWDLFDPAARLPRDPATLSMNLEGQVVLSEPVGRAAQSVDGDLETPVPMRPTGLTLSRLVVSGLGAALSGQGQLDFTGAITPDTPYGAPEGEIAVVFTGLTPLLDALSEIGAIDAARALGARMALGFFTTEGEAPNTRTTTLSFSPDGTISVNGQQVGRFTGK